MNQKLEKAYIYLLLRMGEPSFWQGVGFIVGLTGSKFGAGMDWGQAAGLGGVISAVIKMLLPDKWGKR